MDSKTHFDMSKLSNVSTLTERDLKDFFSLKELQYEDRRKLIQKYCNIIGSVYKSFETSRTMIVRNESLIYNPKDNVAYCQIAKVNESIITWLLFNLQLTYSRLLALPGVITSSTWPMLQKKQRKPTNTDYKSWRQSCGHCQMTLVSIQGKSKNFLVKIKI